jgi:hypothetical protein
VHRTVGSCVDPLFLQVSAVSGRGGVRRCRLVGKYTGKFCVTERVLGWLEFRELRAGDWHDNGGSFWDYPPC